MILGDQTNGIPDEEQHDASPPSIDLSGYLDEQLAHSRPDLLREMPRTFAQALMATEASAACGDAASARLRKPQINSQGEHAAPGRCVLPLFAPIKIKMPWRARRDSNSQPSDP